jgi:hypothetical protein
VLAGATPTSSLVLREMAIFAGGWHKRPPTQWIFEIDSKQIAKKILGENPTSHPPTHRRLRIFSRKVTTLRGCRSSNLWPPPHAKPPLPLHHTLICVHLQFWFYTYYTTPSVHRFLGTKRIQIKNLSTTKFNNFLRSTTFMLGVFPFEVIYEIWISNLDFIDNMISNKKFVNYEVS